MKIDTSVEKEKTMAKKAERTRETILQLSYPLFAQKGFKQVTMKDVCEVTGLSRGGLYSHFSSTAELFADLVGNITSKDAMDFEEEIKNRVSARKILEKALQQMEAEMLQPQDSLSVAIYEYAETIDHNVLTQYNIRAVKKWSHLIRYGIEKGEFQEADVDEIVQVILYSYQGIRMWSRIVPIRPKTAQAICNHIRKTLTGETR